MSSSLEPNANLHIHITPGSETFQTLQDYLRSQVTHTRQLTDTEQAGTDRMSQPLMQFIGSKIKQDALHQLTKVWPAQTDVFDSVFKSIANYTESQNNAEDRTKKIKMRFHHPGGYETPLDLSQEWQFAAPLMELGKKEPNAKLYIHVRPDRKEFSLLQSTLQQQGFSTRSLTDKEQDAINAIQDDWQSTYGKDVYWDVDKQLSEDWPRMDSQAEIKRNIYTSIASYTKEDNQAEDPTNKIEMDFYHPERCSAPLDLSRAAIPF